MALTSRNTRNTETLLEFDLQSIILYPPYLRTYIICVVNKPGLNEKCTCTLSYFNMFIEKYKVKSFS